MSIKYNVDLSGTCLNGKHPTVEVDMSVHGSEWTTYAVHTNDILHSIYRSNIEDLRLRKCSIKLTKDSDCVCALDAIISPQMEPLVLIHDTSELKPELDDHNLWSRLMIAFETVIVSRLRKYLEMVIMDQICGGVTRNASGVTGWKVVPDDVESVSSSIKVQRDDVVAKVLTISPFKCRDVIKSLFQLESDKNNKTTKSRVEEVDGRSVVKVCNGKPLWDACEEYLKGQTDKYKDIMFQSVGGAAGSFDEQHMYRRILYFLYCCMKTNPGVLMLKYCEDDHLKGKSDEYDKCNDDTKQKEIIEEIVKYLCDKNIQVELYLVLNSSCKFRSQIRKVAVETSFLKFDWSKFKASDVPDWRQMCQVLVKEDKFEQQRDGREASDWDMTPLSHIISKLCTNFTIFTADEKTKLEHLSFRMQRFRNSSVHSHFVVGPGLDPVMWSILEGIAMQLCNVVGIDSNIVINELKVCSSNNVVHYGDYKKCCDMVLATTKEGHNELKDFMNSMLKTLMKELLTLQMNHVSELIQQLEAFNFDFQCPLINVLTKFMKYSSDIDNKEKLCGEITDELKILKSKDILLDLPFGVIKVKIDEIIKTARDSKLFENYDFASVCSIVVKDDKSWRREIENIIYVENNEEMVERLETLVNNTYYGYERNGPGRWNAPSLSTLNRTRAALWEITRNRAEEEVKFALYVNGELAKDFKENINNIYMDLARMKTRNKNFVHDRDFMEGMPYFDVKVKEFPVKINNDKKDKSSVFYKQPTFPLKERVKLFLGDKTKATLLLLGDAGCGKSVCARALERELWIDGYIVLRICLWRQ